MLERTAVDLVPNLVSGHRRNGRTVYDPQAKRELVRRVLEPGVSLAGTALAHGINANLLRRWVVSLTGQSRRAARREAALVRVQVQEKVPVSAASPEGWVEVVLGRAVVRVRGRIERETLQAVIDCVAERA